MSSSPQYTGSGTTSPGPMFSYAQAAMGRSPSLSHRPKKPLSDTTETGTKDQRVENLDELEKVVTPRRASEGQIAPKIESEHKTERAINSAPALPPKSPAVSHTAVSTPTTPDLSSLSVSTTLPKEDDLFVRTNGSSDSTFDKHSQTSQNGEENDSKSGAENDGEGGVENSEKEGVENEDAKALSWDQVPAASQLRPAPPPSFNIWDQRKEKQAKASKDLRPVLSTAFSSSKGSGLPNGLESQKPDLTRRRKPGSHLDESKPPGVIREVGKSGDRTVRDSEEGISYFQLLFRVYTYHDIRS